MNLRYYDIKIKYRSSILNIKLISVQNKNKYKADIKYHVLFSYINKKIRKIFHKKK